jgi:hypothetical protein
MTTNTAPADIQARRIGGRFVLVAALIDVAGLGAAFPVLPMLVGVTTSSLAMQDY